VIRATVLALSVAWTAASCPPAAAQSRDWPAKPVRLVVTFPPGGASDVVARALAPRLAGGGPQWIVDNRPGADGMIGAEVVARAPADGYTLLVANVGPQAIAPAMHAKVRYDALRDFTYIAHIGSNAHALLVTPSFPPRNLKEFVALAPEIPTFVEQGYRDLIVENWVGLAGPAKLGAEITQRVAADVEQALASAELRQRLNEIGVTPSFKSTSDFARYVEQEARRWRSIVDAAGVRAE
jgi:tripartite-type tricarboxylate transporter receptor subunit TctC